MRNIIIEYRDGNLVELRVDGISLKGVTSFDLSLLENNASELIFNIALTPAVLLTSAEADTDRPWGIEPQFNKLCMLNPGWPAADKSISEGVITQRKEALKQLEAQLLTRC